VVGFWRTPVGRYHNHGRCYRTSSLTELTAGLALLCAFSTAVGAPPPGRPWFAAATSAPGLGAPQSNQRCKCNPPPTHPPTHTCARTRPSHIRTGTGLAPPTSAPGLGSPLPHLHQDWARPSHICTRTGLTPATPAPGVGFFAQAGVFAEDREARVWTSHARSLCVLKSTTMRGTRAESTSLVAQGPLALCATAIGSWKAVVRRSLRVLGSSHRLTDALKAPRTPSIAHSRQAEETGVPWSLSRKLLI
jgi:hypothetical protein